MADYARALSRCDAVRLAWERAGAPVTCLGGSTGRVEAINPLLAAQQSAEEHVAKLEHADAGRERVRSERGTQVIDASRPGNRA